MTASSIEGAVRADADLSLQRSILDDAHIAFGREICGDLASGLRREWLVTNGIGGYASGSLPGVLTRSYHGLLVAALEPPVARTVLVAGTVDIVTYGGTSYPLSTHEFGDGGIAPEGYRNLESFRLEGTLPVWSFRIADALIERRIWMDYGANTTYLSYAVARGSLPIDLDVTPLVTYHTFHALASGSDWSMGVTSDPTGATINAFDGAIPFWLGSDRAAFNHGDAWWWNFRHRAESERGLGDHGDLFAPGTFRVQLQTGDSVAFVFSTEPEIAIDAQSALSRFQQRQRDLLARAGATESDAMTQQLVLAADQFLVARPLPDNADGRSVIAGYHWFNDWGRDTMISLPGLTLSTGRAPEAASILRTFAKYLAGGLLPNNFPDNAGVVPGYNTADATLWFVIAIRAYEESTGDESLADDLISAVVDIIDCHIAGTRYHIGVDPADGLLRAGEPGVQLTWMDAKVGDWVVTPRIGKPVEINALWYNTLRIAAELTSARGDAQRASNYLELAQRVRASFRTRFWHPDHGYLADVIDGPDGDDWALRPNQVFAISLPFVLLEGDEASTVLDAIGRSLLTSYGLRSLAPDDTAYIGTYGGDQLSRDGAYHQGPVWGWLLGPYAEAIVRVKNDMQAAKNVLSPIADHLRDAGLGSISEIFEGNPSHMPAGCVAQAWSVAETLRVWRMVQ